MSEGYTRNSLPEELRRVGISPNFRYGKQGWIDEISGYPREELLMRNPLKPVGAARQRSGKQPELNGAHSPSYLKAEA
jgi:hypothetical protein